ncbi:hypothetical protein BC835DRAFT_1414041 [Cytidiella melzeri]|nr:hypothetical protein BC835DRAFT_1414041 [Cytidiella melzeri]
MARELPPEILYHIVALTCVEYIDERIGTPLKQLVSKEDGNPIIPLLQTNHQLRKITQKVLFDALGVATNEDGRYKSLCATLAFNGFFHDSFIPNKRPGDAIEWLRKFYNYAVNSHGPILAEMTGNYPHKTEASSLVPTYTNLVPVFAIMHSFRIVDPQDDMMLEMSGMLDIGFTNIMNSVVSMYRAIKPPALSVAVGCRVIDDLQKAKTVRVIFQNLMELHRVYNDMQQYSAFQDRPEHEEILKRIAKAVKNVVETKHYREPRPILRLQLNLLIKAVDTATKLQAIPRASAATRSSFASEAERILGRAYMELLECYVNRSQEYGDEGDDAISAGENEEDNGDNEDAPWEDREDDENAWEDINDNEDA